MASSSQTEDLYYRYDVMRKVWLAYLRDEDEDGRLSRTGDKYFNNFIKSHRGFQFFLVKIFDGTQHLMVDRGQYETMKTALEKKTGQVLPDIQRPTDVNNPRNEIEGKRSFGSQQHQRKYCEKLIQENEARIRENAAEQRNLLGQWLSKEKYENLIFLAIAIELYDGDFTTVLEIGYVKFTLKEGNKPEYFHAVINDDLHNQEGFDNKDKFKFGTTVRMTKEEAAEQLKKEIAGSDSLVTHSGSIVEQYLIDSGIGIAEKTIFDTQILELNLLPTGTKCWNLKKLLGKMQISHDGSILHNAGNDAHYTMLAFKELVKRAMPVSTSEAASLHLEDPHYRYELMKKVWMGYLRRHHSADVSKNGGNYFSNFIRNHLGFQFALVKIFDGTRHIMVDRELYETTKRELEEKIRAKLPDIHPTNMNDPKNVIERKRVYRDQKEFRKHLKDLMNENIMTQERACENAVEHTDQLCEILSEKQDLKFLSFDLEVHDEDFTTILEIGYVKFTLNEGDKPEYFHAVVNEELHNQQGFDNKEKFGFGKTERMSLEQAAEQLQKAVAGSDALVTHSGHNDLQYLVENDIPVDERTMFDTQLLGLDLLPKGPKCWGLKKILGELNIPYDESILHNAGNDAHYTMLAFKALVKRAMPGTKF